MGGRAQWTGSHAAGGTFLIVTDTYSRALVADARVQLGAGRVPLEFWQELGAFWAALVASCPFPARLEAAKLAPRETAEGG